MTHTVSIPDTLYAPLQSAAAAMGVPLEQLASEAMHRYLEDLQDIAAVAAWQKSDDSKRIPLLDAAAQFGLSEADLQSAHVDD